MSLSDAPVVDLDAVFARDLAGLYEPWQAAPAPDPQLLVLNDALATDLALDAAALRSPDGIAVLVGNTVPSGATPIAMAYAGHQFGGYSPRLGDGRALLLGELRTPGGALVDLHLKGSGRTPFARGGDGKAAVGPMLREYVMSEALHALGIPTTRSLAVVATGEPVRRDTVLPGAVLARVASSHLRVGTFQYAAATGDHSLLQRLVEHAVSRHFPAAADAPNPALALFDAVLGAQATLVAHWMLVGFIHGVMNTDNTTISGETIDYGPCAFLEAFDPATVFSSIDHNGRYAYGNQPQILQWNLARLAETLLPLIDPDADTAVAQATDVLHTFPDRYATAWRAGMGAKLGLTDAHEADADLFDDLLRLMHEQRADYTETFRAMSTVVRGDQPVPLPLASHHDANAWVDRYRNRLATQARPAAETAAAMDSVNPVVIPRNHLVEEALDAATAGDLGPFHQLVEAVTHPYEDRPGFERYHAPASADFAANYQTFCGT